MQNGKHNLTGTSNLINMQRKMLELAVREFRGCWNKVDLLSFKNIKQVLRDD